MKTLFCLLLVQKLALAMLAPEVDDIIRPFLAVGHDGIHSASRVGGELFATQNMILDATGTKVSTSRMMANTLHKRPGVRELPKDLQSTMNNIFGQIYARHEAIRTGAAIGPVSLRFFVECR